MLVERDLEKLRGGKFHGPEDFSALLSEVLPDPYEPSDGGTDEMVQDLIKHFDESTPPPCKSKFPEFLSISGASRGYNNDSYFKEDGSSVSNFNLKETKAAPLEIKIAPLKKQEV